MTQCFIYLNNNEHNLFDLDNVDPPSEAIKNYGIKCPIPFDLWNKKLLENRSNFYPVFHQYINSRAACFLINQKITKSNALMVTDFSLLLWFLIYQISII